MGRIRILLVGSNPDFNWIKSRLGEDKEFLTHHVSNGEDAIAMMLLERYDMAVIESDLNGLYSHEVGHALKQLNPGLLTLLLNANSEPILAAILDYDRDSIFNSTV